VSRYGLRRVRALRPIATAGLLLVLLPGAAWADNCASIGDCFGGLQAAMTAAGTAIGVMVGVMLGGLGGFGQYYRGRYPSLFLPPNLAGPGQYGPYGNPVTDAQGNPTGLYTGAGGQPSFPSRFTDPATGEGYGGTSAGPMIWFSQGLQRAADELIGKDGTGSSGTLAGKA
jgi:hypothetical protein